MNTIGSYKRLFTLELLEAGISFILDFLNEFTNCVHDQLIYPYLVQPCKCDLSDNRDINEDAINETILGSHDPIVLRDQPPSTKPTAASTKVP